MKRQLCLFFISLLVLFSIGLLFRDTFAEIAFSDKRITQVAGIKKFQVSPDALEVIAENMTIPWEIAFLPSGELLVTERPGRLVKIGAQRIPIEVQGAYHIGEGGLLGLAIHPDFKNNQWVYLFLTAHEDDEIINRVERYRLENDKLVDRQRIIDEIPGAPYHNGGRLAFGPDKLLYVTTGDSAKEISAQDVNSLGGKILRVADDGSIPEGNPFQNEVYSLGHRNPQGITWDNKGQLWATEHGPTGVRSGYDELNLIELGQNYGWPLVVGKDKLKEMRSPLIDSGPNEVWAPASIAFWDGSLFFGGLRGETLYEVQFGKDSIVLKSHFQKDFGRIRLVTVGPDGYFYITTSNKDGRGIPQKGDDKIVKIDPSIFRK